MDEIDIRTDTTESVTKIKFADDDSQQYATHVVLSLYDSKSIRLEDCGGCGESDVRKTDVSNLILALQKAVELGWTQ